MEKFKPRSRRIEISASFFSWKADDDQNMLDKDTIEAHLTRGIQLDIVANSIDARESASRTDIYSLCNR